MDGEELEFQHGSALPTRTGCNIVAVDYDALHDRFCMITLQYQNQYLLRCPKDDDNLSEEILPFSYQGIKKNKELEFWV